MLLVRCTYCKGTGRQKCVCLRQKSGLSGGDAEPPEDRGEPPVVLQHSEDDNAAEFACSVCRDTGWMTCPSCCGSGFVEMPALA